MDRTIRVTGKGEIFVKPDIIRLNIHAAGTYREYSLSLRKSALLFNSVNRQLVTL